MENMVKLFFQEFLLTYSKRSEIIRVLKNTATEICTCRNKLKYYLISVYKKRSECVAHLDPFTQYISKIKKYFLHYRYLMKQQLLPLMCKIQLKQPIYHISNAVLIKSSKTSCMLLVEEKKRLL